MAGNTGVCMGGWFRNEIADASALKGMKIRSLGLGGEIYRRLGAVPLTTSPGEIITGLQSGLVDGAEFVGPGSDIALGLYRLAPNYYGPGFNKPNGTGECIVALKVWDALDAQQKAIVAHACAAEAAFALNEMERLNVEALAALTERNGVKLRTFPPAMIEAARGHARDITGEIATKSEIARKIVESVYRLPRARGEVGERLGEGGAGFARKSLSVDQFDRLSAEQREIVHVAVAAAFGPAAVVEVARLWAAPSRSYMMCALRLIPPARRR